MQTTAPEKQTYTADELLATLLSYCIAVDTARDAYYNAKLQIEKQDALKELNNAQRKCSDASHHISRLLKLEAPIDTSAVKQLLNQMQEAQLTKLKTFARQVVTMLDAQQAYFKLANAGYTKEKTDAFNEARKQEAAMRQLAQTLIKGTLAQQTNLF